MGDIFGRKCAIRRCENEVVKFAKSGTFQSNLCAEHVEMDNLQIVMTNHYLARDERRKHCRHEWHYVDKHLDIDDGVWVIEHLCHKCGATDQDYEKVGE